MCISKDKLRRIIKNFIKLTIPHNLSTEEMLIDVIKIYRMVKFCYSKDRLKNISRRKLQKKLIKKRQQIFKHKFKAMNCFQCLTLQSDKPELKISKSFAKEECMIRKLKLIQELYRLRKNDFEVNSRITKNINNMITTWNEKIKKPNKCTYYNTLWKELLLDLPKKQIKNKDYKMNRIIWDSYLSNEQEGTRLSSLPVFQHNKSMHFNVPK